MDVAINASDSATLGVDALDVTDAAAVATSLDAIDDAISTVSTDRAGLGALQNRCSTPSTA